MFQWKLGSDNRIGKNFEDNAVKIHHAFKQITTDDGDITSFRARILAVDLYNMRALGL